MGPIGLMVLTTGSEENPGQTSSFGCPKRLNICMKMSICADHCAGYRMARPTLLI